MDYRSDFCSNIFKIIAIVRKRCALTFFSAPSSYQYTQHCLERPQYRLLQKTHSSTSHYTLVILQWAAQISAWINEHFQLNIAKQFLTASPFSWTHRQ